MATAKKAVELKDEEKSSLHIVKVTPKGVNAVIKNVLLNWCFVDKPQPDKDDPLKASYRTQMILTGGEKEFVNEMKTVLIQYLKSAAVAWGADVREKVLKNCLTLDVDKSLFKQVEQGVSLAAHQTVRRETEIDEFIAKYPPALRLSDNTECPASMVNQEFYSGAIADVAVFISAYEVDAGRGITMYLNGIRKIADGERLSAIDPFADVPATRRTAIADAKKKGLLI